MKKDYRIATAQHVDLLSSRLMQAVEAGTPMSVTVEPYKKRRSVDQNARMWAILTEISQQMPPHMDGVWYAPEVWHEHFKQRFLGMVEGPFGGVPKSTAKLSTVDFSAYVDEIEAWAVGEGVILDMDDTPMLLKRQAG